MRGGVLTLNNQPLAVLPVGSIIETTSEVSPAQLYGGTWEEFGKGKVLVGCDANDTQFNEVLKTGGEKTHTLTIDEMPSHSHTRQWVWDKNGNYLVAETATGTESTQIYTDRYTGHTGGNQPHNNLQPYIVVYRWRRVE